MEPRLIVTLTLLQLALASAARAEDFICDDQTTLTATYQVPEKGLGAVQIAFLKTGEQIVLPQVTSVDGVRYSGGVTEFWVKDSEATLRRAGDVTICKR
jgi:membrane-bound inhibitor of C-type lysozyme